MKLIDMLVEDGLNGWQWPDGVECITQDNGSSVYKGVAFGYVKKPYLKGNVWLANNGTGHADAKIKRYDVVADDWSTAIITRKQYESALAAKNDGWIEWGGGECPVEKGTLVDVHYRDSQAYPDKIGTPALVSGGHGATYHHWLHDKMKNDIIAYRLHQPKEVAQTKAEREVDLNTAAEWNGEGLPLVGCECEWQDKNTKQWNPVKVVYASEWVTVIREINKGKGDDLVEIAIENYGDDARLKFRPTRSEAERKRYDAVQALCDAGGGNGKVDEKAGYGSCWFGVYDAIAAGKIPGVKLED